MIEGVVITNRDICGNRLSNSLVQVLDDNGIVIADERIGTATNGEVITLQFNSVVGKTVKINTGGENAQPDCPLDGSFVQILEVKVYGLLLTPTSAPTLAPTSAPEFPFENIARNGA